MKALGFLACVVLVVTCFILTITADTWPEGLFFLSATVWCALMPFLLPNTWPTRPVKRS